MEASLYWKELLALVLLVLILATEPIYRSPLFNYSLDFIADWQKSHGSPNNDVFFKLVSCLGNVSGCTILMLLVFIFASRKLFLKVCLLFFVALSVFFLFYTFYHQPRPYYASDRVAAIACIRSYGNPSGHSIMIPGVYGSLWLLLFVRKREQPLIQHTVARHIVMWGTLMLLIVAMVLVPISRLYQGLHALNQVIYGSLLGLWMAYTFAVALDRYIDPYIDSVLMLSPAPSLHTPSVPFAIGRDDGLPRGTIMAVVVMPMAIQVLNLILYFALRNSPAFLSPANAARMNAKCPGDVSPMDSSLKGVLHTSLFPLIFVSQIISARSFATIRNWETGIAPSKLAWRLGFVTFTMLIFFVPYMLADYSSFAVQIAVAVILTSFLVPVGLLFVDWLAPAAGIVVFQDQDPRNEKDYVVELKYGTDQVPVGVM